MAISEVEIRAYFSPPSWSFWQWQDGGQVVTWNDGVTIAFRDELLAVLRRLAPTGLPPLGAVLLVLAACRKSWNEPPTRRLLLTTLYKHLGGRRQAEADDNPQLFAAVCDGLDEIQNLDERELLAARVHLCAFLFEGVRDDRGVPNSAPLVEALELGLTSEQLAIDPQIDSMHVLRRDLHFLRLSVENVDADALWLRIKTGLDQPLLPAPVEVPVVGTARSLIQELQDDPELGGVARLARQLLSVVQMPRPVSDLEDLPFGGVSDIANRGPLDRLLLSELAQDDLTMAARVAMGEALYLRREAPPHTPPRQRLVLLDAGIRMWGVPRVFGAAVGLALAAGTNEKLAVNVHRAAGTDLAEVDLTSAAGLNDHLAALDHRAHPGQSLARWNERVMTDGAGADGVIITGEDVWADPAFQRALEGLSIPEWHVATVSREGRFRLLRRTARGSKLVREAHLSLDEILAPRPAAKPLYDAKQPGPLPAFLLQQPFPLLLSRMFDVDCAWHVASRGVLSITKDNRLLWWTHPNRGAQELAAGLPTGKVHWCAPKAVDGVALAVIGRLGQRGLHVLTVDLERLHTGCVPLELDRDTPRGVFFRAGYLFVVFDDRINVVSPATGEMVSSQAMPVAQWQRDRFFLGRSHEQGGQTWFAAWYDGFKLRLEEVPLKLPAGSQAVTMFDAVDIEGPVVVTDRGEIVFSDGRMKSFGHAEQPGRVEVVMVARDGLRFVAKFIRMGHRSRALVFVRTGVEHATENTDAAIVEPHLRSFARPRMVRHLFPGIANDGNRRLVLISRRGTFWPLCLMPPDKYWLSKKGEPADPAVATLHFEPFGNDQPGLSVARWADGSRAVLDSRGLLHLQSSDSSLPEWTVVLSEGETAGWTSDGRWWGPEYFRGGHPATSPMAIYRDVIGPFLERLP